MKNIIKIIIDKLNLKNLLDNPVVSDLDQRYQMSYDQPCQIDCRIESCKFYKGAGVCENISPAITLNKNGKFVCWSKIYI